MDSFAFIIHPIDPRRDIQRKYPLLGKAPDWMIYTFSPLWPPVYLAKMEGITSAATGKQVQGYLIACPLSPKHFLGLPEKRVYTKIIETGRLAEKLGADILGLGAFTSVVGDAGVTIARALDIPVTTGDAYTVAVAVEAVWEAARMMEIPLASATIAVVGATGAIGQVCAEMLAAGDTPPAELLLIGRRLDALQALRSRLLASWPGLAVSVSNDLADLKRAHLVITVTSAVEAVIDPEYIRSGAVICDVARPRDVAAHLAAARQDILVIDGGMVQTPGGPDLDFHFNFGLPNGMAFACMAETITLALEGRFEDYTLGKQIELAHVQEIRAMAHKHGFRLSGFRSFERPVTQEQIDRVRELAHQ